MSRDYISQEVEKIFSDERYKFPLNMAMSTAWILGNYKGINLKILDMQENSSLSDYFILASATNLVQASSMAEEVLFQMKKKGFRALSSEGLKGSDWVLLDLGDIIVHIFVGPAREVYDLDGLWKSSDNIAIPQEYYFSSENPQQGPDNKGYF